MEISLFDFTIFQIGSFVILTSLIIAFLLLFKTRGSKIANQLISLIVIFSSITILINLIVSTGIYNQFTVSLFAPIELSFFIPPAIYFYFRTKLSPKSVFKLRDVVHLILPSSITVFYLISYIHPFLDSNSVLIYFTVESILFLISLTYYLYSSHTTLKKFVLDKKWHIPLIKWLTLFLKVLIILYVSEIFFFFCYELLSLNKTGSLTLEFLQLLIDLSLLAWVSINAYKQYHPEKIFNKAYVSGETSSVKELQTVNTDDLKSLIYLMEEEKLYLNQDLNLEILSNRLKLSKRKLSVLISENYHKSFTTFINDYRLKEVIYRLNHGEYFHYTILAIAYDSGFSSRSTFYRYFNDKMGMTPNEFIEISETRK